jgi:hypothetical protein
MLSAVLSGADAASDQILLSADDCQLDADDQLPEEALRK